MPPLKPAAEQEPPSVPGLLGPAAQMAKIVDEGVRSCGLHFDGRAGTPESPQMTSDLLQQKLFVQQVESNVCPLPAGKEKPLNSIAPV